MRPIDGDALKEDLSRFYAGEVTARDLIDEQPTIGGWISVKDRMPDECVMVLAVVKEKDCWWRTIAWLNNNKWKSGDPLWVYDDGQRITHWMPLPEPPKEDTP